MLRILFAVLFVALITESSGCPDGWEFYEGDKTCLKYFSKPENWSNARKSCQSFGGDLVIIRDKIKNKLVLKMAKVGRLPWIGVRNHDNYEYNFKYVDGSSLGSYQPWATGEPDGNPRFGVKCVRMYDTGPNVGVWADINCTYRNAYVCSTNP